MLIRPATPTEFGDPTGFTVTDPVAAVDTATLRAEAAAGRMRPEWTWVADDGGRIVGRGVWWGRTDGDRPLTLDCLHVHADVDDRAALAADLLARAHDAFGTRPEYQLIRRDPAGPDTVDGDAADAVAWRTAAATAAGLTDVVERLRYEWTPDAGVAGSSGRLTFRSASDEEFLDAFRRVAVGSLDVATRRDVATVGADAQAREDLEFYRSCPGDRSWWRLAETPDGRPAGFAVPSATPHHRNVGYLGVLPELRGRGHVDDLLAEITRRHASDGADRITATTDSVNIPMAAAFDRAGYRVTETRTVFSAPSG